MIKFFRHIRKDLMGTKKTSTYFKYAIGEIVLVVIGILIALSINNWNQNRINKQEELQTIKSLLAELESNYTSFQESYYFNVNRLNGVVQYLKMDASKSLEYMDSLNSIVLFSNTYNPSFGLYNTMISSGKIENISNDALKIKIAKFKDIIIDYQQEEEYALDYSRNTINQSLIYNDLVYSEVGIWTKERLRTPKEKTRDKKNFITGLKDSSHRKMILLLMLYLNEIYEEGIPVLTEFKTLITMMKEEINILEN